MSLNPILSAEELEEAQKYGNACRNQRPIINTENECEEVL